MQGLLETNERICYQNVGFFLCVRVGWPIWCMGLVLLGMLSGLMSPVLSALQKTPTPEPCVVAGGFHVS